MSDEKESEIERRWVKNCARERTGKLSKKTTKEGGLDTNQQGLELGLGVGVGLVIGFCQIGLRFAKKEATDRATLHREAREGYTAPRSQKGGVPTVRKEETAALDEARNGGRDG